MANVEPVQSCINLSGNFSNNSTNIVSCMAGNLARNVIPIAIFILFAFAFIIGFAGLASNIIGLIKATQRQTRISSILASMLFNVTLMNIPFLFRIIANTLISPSTTVFTSNGINSSSSLLAWTATETNFQDWCNLFTHFYDHFIIFWRTRICSWSLYGQDRFGSWPARWVLRYGKCLYDCRYFISKPQNYLADFKWYCWN